MKISIRKTLRSIPIVFHVVPPIPKIILETIGSLNEINPLANRLIQIARDGKITDDELQDLKKQQRQLDIVRENFEHLLLSSSPLGEPEKEAGKMWETTL